MSALLTLVASFWIWDLRVMPPTYRYPSFDHHAAVTLKDGKDQAHIWVERNLNENAPSKKSLDELTSLLKDRVIDTERDIFGLQPTPPSKDRDLHLLIAAIPPYEKNGKKFGHDGFFMTFDQWTEEEAQKEGQHSNGKNIIYVNVLHDIGSDYMHGVIAHELAHLLTYDHNVEGWLNEMLGEAAMQLTQHFTDRAHVEKYRANSEWPLAVDGYGISYGALSMLAEYLLKNYKMESFKKLAQSKTEDPFKRIEEAYSQSWKQVFEGYVRWLYEQNPNSEFSGSPVQAKVLDSKFRVAATGVTYLSNSAGQTFRITATPTSCTSSQNVVRTSVVSRDSVKATAVWVESTPPCTPKSGGSAFDKDAFELQIEKKVDG